MILGQFYLLCVHEGTTRIGMDRYGAIRDKKMRSPGRSNIDCGVTAARENRDWGLAPAKSALRAEDNARATCCWTPGILRSDIASDKEQGLFADLLRDNITSCEMIISLASAEMCTRWSSDGAALSARPRDEYAGCVTLWAELLHFSRNTRLLRITRNVRASRVRSRMIHRII